MNKVITISREFGSGGRTIGRKAALKLGIKCCDQELIEEIAKQMFVVKGKKHRKNVLKIKINGARLFISSTLTLSGGCKKLSGDP
uniref:Cytidylate kinase n=1 Tax=Eubacterium cellulosolvens (strain ATCC 43171 / JCM 9499 / 6) TaxID=633697 RepID=I5AXT1_EUBC6